jgi:peptidoglycan/LPS O-acetylase OafA/YrhL
MFHLHWSIYMLTPFRMDLLAVGALLAVLWRSHRDKIERYGVYGPVLSVAAIAVLALLARQPNFSTSANTRESNVLVYELTLIASTGIILWALSGQFVGVLRWPPIRYVGRISYSIYLIHLTVLLVVERYVGGRNLVAAISVPLILGYAALSWHFFEKPLLASGSKNEAISDADEVAITEAGRQAARSRR